MTTGTILKEDRVASTIHFINQYNRMATHQAKTPKCASDYFVMTGNTVEMLIDSYQNKAAKTALVVDDLGLQITNRLYQEGPKKITLCLARISVDQMDAVKMIITNTFPDIRVDIIHINDIKENMNFDLIIANPPYGKIGADITKKLIDTIDFTEYVNLLPANDYKRNTTKDLFNYQSDMTAINDGFTDAVVTTHVAKIHKTKVNNMTVDEFERSNYIDRQLDKYFAENAKRKDFVEIYKPTVAEFAAIKIDESIYIPKRLVANKHFAYDINCLPNQYNFNMVTKDFVIANSAKSEQKLGNVGDFYLIKCSSIEKTNFINFIYSASGFRFMAKVLTAVNADSAVSCNKYLPKVDWSRSWTVEEILADYGYDADEIQAVMDDLKNFKGMDD